MQCTLHIKSITSNADELWKERVLYGNKNHTRIFCVIKEVCYVVYYIIKVQNKQGPCRVVACAPVYYQFVLLSSSNRNYELLSIV